MVNLNGVTLLIVNGKVVLPDHVLCDGCVAVAGSRIVWVGSFKDVPDTGNTPRIDAKEGLICPGFVDLHVNGGGGRDITEATEEAVTEIARAHARCGTTSLLVAVTGPSEQLGKRELQAAAVVSRRTTGGARVLGAHMEGPYVNPKKQGPVFRTFPRAANPAVEKMKEFIDASEGALRIVTIAPELSGAIPVIEYLASVGVVPSIGHTEANYDEVLTAVSAGARYSAHIFNAMTGVHHREPGTAVGLLTAPEIVVELIADGHHVHPGVVRLVRACKGVGGLVLASDATEVVGTNLKEFTLPIGGGFRVEVRDGRTWGPDGQLIGSILQMNHAVRNLRNWCELPINEAVSAATLQPARILGRSDLGVLEAGKEADIAILSSDFEIIATVVAGDIVYRA